jgi:signal transduction histidine kinase
VLIAGFSLVILLLLAAAVVGVRSIQSIRQSAGSLVRGQAVTNRLVDELQSQQKSLSEVFSILARDPDSVDYEGMMRQLEQADTSIARISAEGERTAEASEWRKLRRASNEFSKEARRLLMVEDPETFSSVDLIRYHGNFVSVVAQLIESEYRKVNQAQVEIDSRSSQLLRQSAWFAGGSMLLAVVFAIFTVSVVKRLARAIELQAEELGRVSWQMMADQEAAARRFSHELHDELGQSLTAVKTNLSALQANGGLDHGRLEDSIGLIDDSIANVRQMSQLLHPTILDDFGLEAGLRWLVEGFATRTGLDVDFASTFTGRLPEETETNLFRIAQEALTNVARHACAKRVRMRLDPAAGGVRLEIADDGRGMDPAADVPRNGRGLGIVGMRARARIPGGDMRLRSKPGEGVVIEVWVPLGDEAHTHTAG